MTQITIRELLKDAEYAKYFRQVPVLPDHYRSESKPWCLYVQLKGTKTWKKKRYGTYAEAYKGLKKILPLAYDAAINCPGLGFRPPIKTVKPKGATDRSQLRSMIWRPALGDDHAPHHWCSYCRRPTVWKVLAARLKTYSGSTLFTEPRLRCTICSSSEVIVNLKHPEKEQGWDVNRPVLYPIITK